MKLVPITPERLKEWRENRSLSVEQTYTLLHVSRMTYYRMENVRVSSPYILALALYALDLILKKPKK